MIIHDSSWEQYFEERVNRKPNPFLVEVSKRYRHKFPSLLRGFAIDLGCGEGVETEYLLRDHWKVLSVDAHPLALEHLKRRLPTSAKKRLTIQLSRYEIVKFPPADLIYAGYSLHYCDREKFPLFWTNLISSLKLGGRFVGQFIGDRDPWASNDSYTTFSEKEVHELFSDLEIEVIRETHSNDKEKKKCWHFFTVIACNTISRKKSLSH
jgi:tellurite methyltransferase